MTLSSLVWLAVLLVAIVAFYPHSRVTALLLSSVGSLSGPASGRAKYGTFIGNLKWFAGCALMPTLPLLVLFVSRWFEMHELLRVFVESTLTAISIALTILVVSFLLLYPVFARRFLMTLETDEDDERRPTRWLEPWSYRVPEGRCVARTGSGGGVVDYNMRQGDRDFACDVHQGPFATWIERYNVEIRNGSPADLPVPSVWHRYHVAVTRGLMFGGFYWYTELYWYKIDIVKAKIGPDGRIELQILPDNKTDHVRVRPFAWAVIADVFTRDRYRVTLVFTFELACVNPDKTLFGRDRWERLFSQRVSNRAVEAAKQISIFDLLGGHAAGTRTHMADRIRNEANTIEATLGLKVIEVQVPGYIQVGDNDDERKALTAEAVARQNARVTLVAGKAEAISEARVVKARGKAAADQGDIGAQVSLHQAMETAAKDGATIIANLGTGGSGDPTSQAILAELQRLNAAMAGGGAP